MDEQFIQFGWKVRMEFSRIKDMLAATQKSSDKRGYNKKESLINLWPDTILMERKRKYLRTWYFFVQKTLIYVLIGESIIFYLPCRGKFFSEENPQWKLLEVFFKRQKKSSYCLWKQCRARFFSDSMNSKYLISLSSFAFNDGKLHSFYFCLIFSSKFQHF